MAGCDKGFEEKAFVLRGCRNLNIMPYAASKRSGGEVDGRTARHGAIDELSQAQEYRGAIRLSQDHGADAQA